MSLARTTTGRMSKPRQGKHGQGARLGATALKEETANSCTLSALHRDILSLIPSMRAFARRLTRNQADADDLVQDTLVKAIGHIHQFTPGTIYARGYSLSNAIPTIRRTSSVVGM